MSPDWSALVPGESPKPEPSAPCEGAPTPPDAIAEAKSAVEFALRQAQAHADNAAFKADAAKTEAVRQAIVRAFRKPR